MSLTHAANPGRHSIAVRKDDLYETPVAGRPGYAGGGKGCGEVGNGEDQTRPGVEGAISNNGGQT